MPMFNWIQKSFQLLGQHGLPCTLCEVAPRFQTYVLCKSCWQQLPWLQQTIQRHEQHIFVACHYQYPIDRVLQQFKYEQKLHYQTLLHQTLDQLKLPKVHAIVPMPISSKRLIERGYNQALLLAEHLSKSLHVPVWQPVERLEQHSQKGLSRVERLDHIDQQFVISTPPKIRYRKVLIVDDVVTTGSSIDALRQALHQVGCKQIYACCVAAAGQTKANSLYAKDTTA